MRYLTRRTVHKRIAVLQRRWRSVRQLRDPITLDSMCPPVFFHVDDRGGCTQFGARVLAEYVTTTGDTRNPLTRRPFLRVELMRLARLSRIPGVSNIEALQTTREVEIERESLRTFFIDEMTSDLALLNEFSSSRMSVGYLTRHILSLTFPTIVVNVVRVLRSDAEFIEVVFDRIRETLQRIREGATSSQFIMSLHVFEQFVRDLKEKADDGSLVTGTRASVSIGGVNISLNLEDI